MAARQAALNEFLVADALVVGAPMYNFSIPSQLKAWIDRVAVPGKTFRYARNGPHGLARGKKDRSSRRDVATPSGRRRGARGDFQPQRKARRADANLVFVEDQRLKASVCSFRKLS